MTAPIAAISDVAAPIPAGVPQADAASDLDAGNDAATPPVVSSNDDLATADTGFSGDNHKTKNHNKGKDHQNNDKDSINKDSSKSKSGDHGNGHAKGHDKHSKH